MTQPRRPGLLALVVASLLAWLLLAGGAALSSVSAVAAPSHGGNGRLAEHDYDSPTSGTTLTANTRAEATRGEREPGWVSRRPD
jgi:hypothetical protein